MGSDLIQIQFGGGRRMRNVKFKSKYSDSSSLRVQHGQHQVPTVTRSAQPARPARLEPEPEPEPESEPGPEPVTLRHPQTSSAAAIVVRNAADPGRSCQ